MKTASTAALVALAMAGSATLTRAQQQQPAPREQVTATLRGKKVTVDYGRPALKGRTLDELMASWGPIASGARARTR